jgi:selenium-binding protein 1
MEAPVETLAFTLMLSPDGSQPDGLAVVDVDPNSEDLRPDRPSGDHAQQGRRVSPFRLERLFLGAVAADRACLSGTALPDHSRHPVEPDLRHRREGAAEGQDPQDHRARRGLRQDRLFAPAHDPLRPRGHLCLDAGRRRPDGTDGPPGIFIMDCETFEILGRYEMDRGEQDKHYDFWWNLPRDYMVSSEWGLPPQFENGIVAEDLLSNKYGHKIHFWNLRERKNVQTIDLGANHQMALEIRPAHDPAKDYGFCGVVVDTTNLQGAIFTWWQKDDGTFEAKKTITIDPRPERPRTCRRCCRASGGAAAGHRHRPQPRRQVPLRRLLGPGRDASIRCLRPDEPQAGRQGRDRRHRAKRPHPNGKPFGYGPQMVEISRDGKRVYWTNSLYSTWDDQFYPGDGAGRWSWPMSAKTAG